MKYWIKICWILAILSLGYASNTFAQEEEEVEIEEMEDIDEAMGADEYRQKGFQLQRIFTGGTVGLNFGNALYIQIAPQLGYRVTDHLHVGGSISYSVQSQRISPGVSASQNVLGGGVFARYMLINFNGFKNNYGKETGLPMSGLYATAGYERSRYKDNFNNIEEKINTNALYLGGGYTSNFYRGFGYYVELTYDVLYDEFTSFTPWPIVPKAGIYFGF